MPRHTRRVIFHHPAEVRHVQRTATYHHRIAARLFQARLRAFVIPDFAIGNNRNGEPFADLTDRLPVNAIGFVAIFFGAAMYYQLCCPGLLHRIGNFKLLIVAVPAQAHFDRHRQMRRHGFTHRLRASVYEFRIFQQRCPATAAVDQLRRTTAVEIDTVRAQLDRAGGVFRQPLRILT